MNKASITGIIAAIIVIVSAFLPWLTVESKQLVFTGLQTAGSRFGEPGKLNIAMAALTALLFLGGRKWMLRVNLFVAAFLLAWTFRNFLLFGRCEMGECPQREAGLFLSLLGALTAFICVLVNKGNK